MRGNKSALRIAGLLAISATIVVEASVALASSTEKVLYRFQGGSDGSQPLAGLVADSAGDLYSTTSNGGNGACQGGCGTVFELTPNPQGGWTENQLYSFSGGNDGAIPETSVIFDQAGSLYGTTLHGGSSNDGTVFRLTPPTQAGGAWTETVLHNFLGQRDGEYCFGGLVFDPTGNLYGAGFFGGVYGGGTVFQLVAPVSWSGAWTLKVLHSFKGVNDGIDPLGALILDKKGSIYGMTYDGGVFRLTAPSSGHNNWTMKVIYRFGSVVNVGALLAGKRGVLYAASALGGSANEGTIIRLTPPVIRGHGWTTATLYEFAGGSDGEYPLNGLIADTSGNLYGATQGGGTFNGGTVFKLTPPAKQGGAWTETILHSFKGGTDGWGPGAGLIFGRHGDLYGTTTFGGSSHDGTVFDIVP